MANTFGADYIDIELTGLFVCLTQGSLQEVWFACGPSDVGIPRPEHGNVLLVCWLVKFIHLVNPFWSLLSLLTSCVNFYEVFTLVFDSCLPF